jgi:hypothetical protein
MNNKRPSATENTEFTEGKNKCLRTGTSPLLMSTPARSEVFSVFSVPSVAGSEV